MDAAAVVALALGVASLMVALMAWRRARDAGAMVDKLAQRMADLAISSPRATVDPDTMVVAIPAPQSPPPIAPLDVAGHDHRISMNETGATLVVRSGSMAGQDLPTNQGTGSGLIGIFLFNQGPATAHDLQLTATFPSGLVRRSGAHHTLSARKEATLFVQILPQDFATTDSVDVIYRVHYRDVNGEHELVQDVRIQGGWKGPWTTFLQDRPHQEPSADGAPVVIDSLAS